MRPLQIEIQGYCSWKQETLVDLSHVSVAAIVGSNGAGKSSLLEAMLYALYGWSRTSVQADQMSAGSKAMNVALNFRVGTETWRVKRHRSKSGSSVLQLARYDPSLGDFEVVGSRSIASTQDMINHLVGVTADDMVASCWLRQGDSARFSQATPAQRRAILEEALALPYAAIGRQAASMVKALQPKIATVEAQRQAAQALLLQVGDPVFQLEELRHRKQQIDAEIENAQATAALADPVVLERLRQQMVRLEREQLQYLAAQDSIAVESIVIVEMQAKRSIVQDQLVDVAEQLHTVQIDIIDATRTVQEMQEQQTEAQTRLEMLDKQQTDQCWTCLQQLSVEAREDLIMLIRNSVSTADKAIRILRENLVTLNKTRDELIRQDRAASAEMTQIDRIVATAQGNIERSRGILQAIPYDPDSLVVVKTQWETAQLQPDPAKAQRELDEALARRADLLRAEGAAQARHQSGDHARKVLLDTQDGYDKLATQLEAVQLLHRSCAPDQIPARIIEGQIPQLADQINVWLTKLTQGRMRIQLLTEKQASGVKGQMVDTLQILVETAEGTRPYDSFSGAERLKVDLACRIGISRVLAARSGSPIRFLIIDEGWGTLDAEGIIALSEAMTELADQFDLILTITHLPQVAMAMPARIEISKDHRGSRAELIAQPV